MHNKKFITCSNTKLLSFVEQQNGDGHVKYNLSEACHKLWETLEQMYSIPY